ncbi:MAG: MarR family transcriptional regulator [Propionibacterium sp.]
MAEAVQQGQLHEVSELAAHVIPLLNRRFRPGGSGMGLGVRSALFALERHGPRRSGDLARLEGVAAPTMTRMMTALVERGHVARRPDPDDGRASLLEITEAGTEALSRARQAYAEHIEEVLRELGPEELERVRGALTELVDAGLAD